MSSTNKTENLGLNSWIGSDKPERTDFNYDNEVLDNAIFQHTSNNEIHITQQERSAWNSSVHMGAYFGNGSAERIVATNCPFDVSFGIIFAANRPISVANFSSAKKTNYTAFFGKLANSLGVKITDKRNFQINQSLTPEFEQEYVSLNESGVAYIYVLMR